MLPKVMQLEGTIDFVCFIDIFSCILIEFDSWLSYLIFDTIY